MYLYWIIITKVHIDKVNSLGKYLSTFSWFGGMNIVDNNFPRGVATVQEGWQL
jgi:hypothetical protein